MTIQITTLLLKDLRDATGVSVMQCKKALEEADGDIEKAKMILKSKSKAAAEKKADRDAKDGIVVVVNGSGKAVMLTLNCETDFVARNEEFVNLANKLAEIALAEGAAKMQESAPEMIAEIVQKIGEKIEVGKVEVVDGTVLGSYVHGGKKAVVVALSGGTPELAKDIAMHIAAMNPSYIKRSDVDQNEEIKAKEIFEKELEGNDKPADIKEKILKGKIDTFFKEQTLLDQSFIKNPDLTVGTLLQNSGATIEKFIKESIG